MNRFVALAALALIVASSLAWGQPAPSAVAGHGDLEIIGGRAGHGDLEIIGGWAGHGDLEIIGG
jgi:hypothetical protein